VVGRKELMYELEDYKTEYKKEMICVKETIKFINSNENLIRDNNENEHITASVWIINEDMNKCLLVHHKKLNKWIQIGGHVDDSESAYDAAVRETKEETGLVDIKLMGNGIFDISIFEGMKKGRKHKHYDVIYLFQANENDKLIISDESNELKWININDINRYTNEEEILRLAEKTKKLR